MRHWWHSRKAEEKADQELAKSLKSLEDTRRKIKPMEDIYQHNRFAGIIKDALGIGWDQGPGTHSEAKT